MPQTAESATGIPSKKYVVLNGIS